MKRESEWPRSAREKILSQLSFRLVTAWQYHVVGSTGKVLRGRVVVVLGSKCLQCEDVVDEIPHPFFRPKVARR